MSPRPILKRASTTNTTSSRPPYSGHDRLGSSHVVHFPPSPTLTRTFSAHSPNQYDRSPIVVAPNSCALPERGCPGRTYTLDADDGAPPPGFSALFASRPPSHKHMHPRAVNNSSRSIQSRCDGGGKLEEEEDDDADRTPTRAYPLLPPLIPDLSSESDESDGFYSPPPEPFATSSSSPFRIRTHDKYASRDPFTPTTPTALSYLPHPHPSPSQYTSHDREDDAPKARRRPPKRPRDRERVEDGSKGGRASKHDGGSYKSFSLCNALSNCSLSDADGGCLDGF